MNSRLSIVSRPAPAPRPGLTAACISYAALLAAFWMAARFFRLPATISHFPSAFAGFALLWAPYWFFGFGLAGPLRAAVEARWLRLLAPALLVIPYLVFSFPRHGFHALYATVFLCLPVLVAAVLEFAPADDGFTRYDLAAMLLAGIPVEFGLLRGAWPQAGLCSMPKLLLMDALLYGYLVVRRLPNIGYDFRPRWRDLAVGLREWAFFAPLAIALGLALHFIVFRPHLPSGGAVAAAWLVTFFFVAIPEEFFFRGLLQNLLENRLSRAGASGSRMKALLIAAPIFGLSHFNKPLPFNWRYVLLATLAGIFYGRAWRDHRRLFGAGITHATVDTVWSLWFR